MSKLETTKLKSIDFGEHEGFHITKIKDLDHAFNIRLHLNRLMVDKGIVGHVIINESPIDIFVYGLKADDFECCKEIFKWVK
jgi:hypothetical protein